MKIHPLKERLKIDKNERFLSNNNNKFNRKKQRYAIKFNV